MLCSTPRKKYLLECHDQGIIHQQRHFPLQTPCIATIPKPFELVRKQAMAGNKNKRGCSYVQDGDIRRYELTPSHGSNKYTIIISSEKDQQIG